MRKWDVLLISPSYTFGFWEGYSLWLWMGLITFVMIKDMLISSIHEIQIGIPDIQTVSRKVLYPNRTSNFSSVSHSGLQQFKSCRISSFSSFSSLNWSISIFNYGLLLRHSLSKSHHPIYVPYILAPQASSYQSRPIPKSRTPYSPPPRILTSTYSSARQQT